MKRREHVQIQNGGCDQPSENHNRHRVFDFMAVAAAGDDESPSLECTNAELDKGRVEIWAQQTKRHRIIPIASALRPIVPDAFEDSPDSESRVVHEIVAQNVLRDFGAIRQKAGVAK